MVDQSRVDEAALKRLGARGMIKPSATALQVVVGAEADQVAGEMRIALPLARLWPGCPVRRWALPRRCDWQRITSAAAAAVSAPTNAPAPAHRRLSGPTMPHGRRSGAPAGTPAPRDPAVPPIPTSTLAALLSALGGRTNIRTIETASTRLRINIVDPKVVNESAITALGLRGIANAAPNWLHVIVGPQAASAGVTLRQLL